MNIQGYQLQGNRTDNGSVIGNLVYDDLGELLIRKLNEEFIGVKNIKYDKSTMLEKGNPISYSNTPRALFFNQILREITQDIHVLSLEEVIKYWNKIENKESNYADTNSIVIYPKKGFNEFLKKQVLDIINRRTLKVPLIVKNLSVKKSNNNYGFEFTGNDFVTVTENPNLTKCEIISGNGAAALWTSPSGQSGLNRLYRCRGLGLNVVDDYLFYSNDNGRVQVTQDLEHRTKE
ncbi:hypothetical protein K8R47_04165 [archaeon]|nr:hypothetical protein [archaeon]